METHVRTEAAKQKDWRYQTSESRNIEELLIFVDRPAKSPEAVYYFLLLLLLRSSLAEKKN